MITFPSSKMISHYYNYFSHAEPVAFGAACGVSECHRRWLCVTIDRLIIREEEQVASAEMMMRWKCRTSLKMPETFERAAIADKICDCECIPPLGNDSPQRDPLSAARVQ